MTTTAAAGPILVAGCGSIGRRHLRNLAAIGAAPLIAFDPDPARAAQAAGESGATPVSNLALAPRPSAVFVCNPTRHHLAMMRHGLEQGAHLFVEKPIADMLDGVDEVLADARRGGRVVMVAFNLRYLPALQRIKQLLDEGQIGRAIGARIQFGQFLPDWHPWEDYRRGYSANRSLGGGIVLDAVHEFDYARWLLGDVRAIGGMMTTTGTIEIDTEDLAAFTLIHEGGAISEIHLDYLQRTYARTCQVIGTAGTIDWDWSEQVVRCYRADTKKWAIYADPPDYDDNDTYVAEARAFLDAIAGGAAPPVDGHAGRRVLEIALAGKRAATTGRTVTL